MPKTRRKQADNQTDSGEPPLQVQMDRLLCAALPHVRATGWNAEALVFGARDIGLSPARVHRLFPSGAKDLLRHFHDHADRGMLDDLAKAPGFSTRRVREKVRDAVLARLARLTPHKVAVREALAHYACPWNTVEGVRALCHTLDAIWGAADDTAIGLDRYTKRGLLAGVYSATLLFWLNDTSPDHSATRAFLTHRIDEAMKLGRVVGGFKPRRGTRES